MFKNKSVESLGLPARTQNALLQAGLKTLGDLVEVSHTAGLYRIPALGQAGRASIKASLERLGLDLNERPVEEQGDWGFSPQDKSWLVSRAIAGKAALVAWAAEHELSGYACGWYPPMPISARELLQLFPLKREIIWCPQHQITATQREELGDLFPGIQVVTLQELDPELFKELADSPPDWEKLTFLSERLMYSTWERKALVLPIGSPAFQLALGQVMSKYPARPRFLWAHSVRESEDIPQADGSTKKVSVFRHKGFFGTPGPKK